MNIFITYIHQIPPSNTLLHHSHVQVHHTQYIAYTFIAVNNIHQVLR
jgi:hypothetical protein